MKKRMIASATILTAPLALGISAGQAKADGTITARLGVSNLVESSVAGVRTRDLDMGLSFGVNGKTLLSSMHSKSSIDLDYKAHTGKGNQLSSLAATYVERVPFGVRAPGSRRIIPYVGLGVGVGYTNTRIDSSLTVASAGSNPSNGEVYAGTVRLSDEGSNGGSNTGVTPQGSGNTQRSSWKTSVAAKALVGLELTDRFFLEAAYNYSPKTAGIRTDTYSLSVGLRF